MPLSPTGLYRCRLLLIDYFCLYEKSMKVIIPGRRRMMNDLVLNEESVIVLYSKLL